MKKPTQITQLLSILLLATFTHCQTNPETKDFASTFGVGLGVVIVSAFIIIGIAICIYGGTTSNPMLFVIIGTIIPIIVFAIFYFIPKQSSRPKTEEREVETDSGIILNYVFVFIAVLLAIASLFFLFSQYVMKSYKAFNLDAGSASIAGAFIGNEEPELKDPPKKDRSKYMTVPQIQYRETRVQRKIPVGGQRQDSDRASRGGMKRTREDLIGRESRLENQSLLQQPRRYDLLSRTEEPRRDERVGGRSILTPGDRELELARTEQYNKGGRRLAPMQDEIQRQVREIDMGIEVLDGDGREIHLEENENVLERTVRIEDDRNDY